MLYIVHPAKLVYRRHGLRNCFIVRADSETEALGLVGRMTDGPLPIDGSWSAVALRDDDLFSPLIVETRALPVGPGGHMHAGEAVRWREG